MLLELNQTKKGNVCLILDGHTQIEAVLKEENQQNPVLFENELVCIIKPLVGLKIQIDGWLYALVEVHREMKEEFWDREDLTIQQKQRAGAFNYSALLVPSNRYTDMLECIYSKEGVEICNQP